MRARGQAARGHISAPLGGKRYFLARPLAGKKAAFFA